MKKYLKYLKTTIRHKWYVTQICFKFGIPLQGIAHDLSKFSLTEFLNYAEYFYGSGDRRALNKAWLRHKGRNKHHPEYWIDWSDGQNPFAHRIPANYVYEIIADWIGAGKAYSGTTRWNSTEPYEYYKKKLRESSTGFPRWELATQAMIDTILVDLGSLGIDQVATRIKNSYYEFMFYCNKVDEWGNEYEYEWMFKYRKLLDEYYSKEEINNV